MLEDFKLGHYRKFLGQFVGVYRLRGSHSREMAEG